jgi:hypothetical protein
MFYRKRGKEGPDACLASTANSAITEAIATAKDRVGEPIFYPYEGRNSTTYILGRSDSESGNHDQKLTGTITLRERI